MMTKPRKATTKPATKGAASGRFDRKPATKGDRLIQLLKARSGCDIAALSGKLGWQPHTTRAALSIADLVMVLLGLAVMGHLRVWPRDIPRALHRGEPGRRRAWRRQRGRAVVPRFASNALLRAEVQSY